MSGARRLEFTRAKPERRGAEELRKLGQPEDDLARRSLGPTFQWLVGRRRT